MDIPHTVIPRRDTGLYNGKVGIWLFLASEVMLFGALFSSYVLLRTGAYYWPQGLLSVPLGTLNTVLLVTSSILIMKGWTSLKQKRFSAFKKYQSATLLLALVFLGIKSLEYNQKFHHYEAWFTDKGAEELAAQNPWLKESGALTRANSVTGHLKGEPYFLDLARLKRQNAAEITLQVDSHKGGEQQGRHHELKITLPQIKRLSAYVPAHSTFFAIYFCITGLHALHVIGGILVIGYLWGPGSRMWRTEPDRFTNRIECTVVYWHFVDFIWLIVFPLFYLFN
jgi:cytochrome c oxidase subunit 3